jgi:hypothetical protein
MKKESGAGRCGDCENLRLTRFIAKEWEPERRRDYGKGYCLEDPAKKTVFLRSKCFTGQFSPCPEGWMDVTYCKNI